MARKLARSRAFTRDELRCDSVPAPPSSTSPGGLCDRTFPVLFNKRWFTRVLSFLTISASLLRRASATLSFDDRFGNQTLSSFVFSRDTCWEIQRLKFVELDFDSWTKEILASANCTLKCLICTFDSGSRELLHRWLSFSRLSLSLIFKWLRIHW